MLFIYVVDLFRVNSYNMEEKVHIYRRLSNLL